MYMEKQNNMCREFNAARYYKNVCDRYTDMNWNGFPLY